MTARSVSKKARAASRGRLTTDESCKILRKVRKAPAVFSKNEMESLESKIRADADGVTRRVALAVLTQSGAKILDSIAGDREAAVGFAECSQNLTDYISRLRQLIEVMEAAQVRLLVGLARREDMHAVLHEAKGDGATQEARP
jgi:hypothetical protein